MFGLDYLAVMIFGGILLPSNFDQGPTYAIPDNPGENQIYGIGTTPSGAYATQLTDQSNVYGVES